MSFENKVARELDELVQRHYYSEDFELLSAVRQFHEGLDAAERDLLREEILRRLQTDGTLVEALLCAVVPDPRAITALVDLLNRETSTSPLSRALFHALSQYTDAAAFDAVARFLDSDQEREALAALAAMDIARTMPLIESRIRRDDYLETCLHIFYDRKKKVGLHPFLDETRAYAAGKPAALRRRLLLSILSKKQEYNPFAPDEIRAIASALDISPE